MINSPAIPYSHIQHSTTETTSTAVGALPIPSIPHSISNNNNVSSGMWTMLNNNYVLSGMCTILNNNYVTSGMWTILNNNYVLSGMCTILNNDYVLSGMCTILNNNYVNSGMCTMQYNDYMLVGIGTMLHNNHMWTILLDMETSITITILNDTHIYSSMWSMLNKTHRACEPCLTRIMPHKSMKSLIWALRMPSIFPRTYVSPIR